jgi:hypothetical protein
MFSWLKKLLHVLAGPFLSTSGEHDSLGLIVKETELRSRLVVDKYRLLAERERKVGSNGN